MKGKILFVLNMCLSILAVLSAVYTTTIIHCTLLIAIAFITLVLGVFYLKEGKKNHQQNDYFS